MRRALSTHLFVEKRLTVATLDRIARTGIPAIELFCARPHLDYHNQSQIDELAYWFRDSELEVHSLHAPMFTDDCWGRSGPDALVNLASLTKARRLAATDEVKRAVALAEQIPVRYVVQHVGVAGEDFDQEKFDVVFNALDELSVFCKQRGVELLLENILNDLSSAMRLQYLQNITHLDFGYCFDVGHAHIHGGVQSEFELMRERIRSTHIHDNDGKADIHLFPGLHKAGTIDWPTTMALLRTLPESVPLLLELAADPELGDPLDAVSRSFAHLEAC